MSKFQNKYLFFIFFLFFLACCNRSKEVLNMKEITNILVELHTLDGIFAMDEFRHLDASEKSKYYEATLEKHRIDRAQFDSSLVWYSRNPKKFEIIYTRVVDRLTTEEEAIRAGKYHPIIVVPTTLASTDIWKDSTQFILQNDSSARNQLAFVIVDSTLMMQDTYVLRFLHKIEQEDSCMNQHIHFNVHYANGLVDSIHYPTHHDGKLRRYTLRLDADKQEKIDSLSMKILASDSCYLVQNAYIDSISLMRKYNANIQNELRDKTELHEEFRLSNYRLFTLPNDKFDSALRRNRINIFQNSNETVL